MYKLIFFIVCFLAAVTVHSQTQFWSDNFETAGPTSGIRTPEENGGVGGPPNTSYFRLTDGSTVSQSVAFTGKQGTFYWAGEDHNAPGTGFTASGAQGAAANSPLNELSITWTGINISGKSGLQFKGLFAANSTNEPWDNIFACAGGIGTTNTDYIIVQYRIDGGAWTDLLRFYTKGNSTGTGFKYLYEDTNNDACGDGTELTNIFGEFVKPITGTGTTLDLRVNVFSEGSNEEWGVDNFRLFYTSALPVNLVDFAGTHQSAGNRLTWATESEQGNSHFEIQRSNNGNDFKNIGTVAGTGNSSTRQYYTFIDNQALPEPAYYRLNQVDADGHSRYSKIIRLQGNAGSTGIEMLPNPVADKLLVKTSLYMQAHTVIRFCDLSGKTINVAVSKKDNGYECDLRTLTNAVYIVTVITDKGTFSRLITKLK